MPLSGSASPSTSPRLPSPPPFPEVQISPKSPQPGASDGAFKQIAYVHTMVDRGASRRIRAGTKASDMASGPPLVPLSEVFLESVLSIPPEKLLDA